LRFWNLQEKLLPLRLSEALPFAANDFWKRTREGGGVITFVKVENAALKQIIETCENKNLKVNVFSNVL
jgi:hypothetical protein